MNYKVLSIFAFLWVSICPATGQKSLNHKWEINLSTHALASITDNAPFRLGNGLHAQVAVNRQINNKNALALAIGYRNLNGYNEELIVFKEYVYPTEYIFITEASRLNGLSYLDFSLGLNRQLGRKSPWGGTIDLRTSYLIRTSGGITTSGTYRDLYSRIEEQSYGGSGGGSSFNDESPFPNESLRQIDFGINLGIYYQIIEGLKIHAGLYQGVLSVYKDGLFYENQHYITSFSVGLSTRIR